MSRQPVWVVASRSEGWGAFALKVLTQQGLRARLLPTLDAVLREPVNPYYVYLLETNDVLETIHFPFHLKRRWVEAGLGTPLILQVADSETWAQFAFVGDLPLDYNPDGIHEIRFPKSDVLAPYEHLEPSFTHAVRALTTLWKGQSEVDRVRYLDLYNELSDTERGWFESLGIERTHRRQIEPTGSILVLFSTFLGDLVGFSYDYAWGNNTWHRPRGLVALAPVEWHSELRRAQVEGRPLFLDICTPDQLRAEGAARVAQWRAQLQAALEAFYAEWAAKLPPLE